MPLFLAGDKVKCIGMGSDYYAKLKVGNIYTVEDIEDEDQDWVTIVEDPECGSYETKYFEHVDPALNDRVSESVPACVIDFVKSTPKKAKAK
jgi:hypothetical protein